MIMKSSIYTTFDSNTGPQVWSNKPVLVSVEKPKPFQMLYINYLLSTFPFL